MKKEAPEQTTVLGEKPLSLILDEIEERAHKATEGPWCWDNRGEKCDDIQVGTACDEFDKPLAGNIENHDDPTYIERVASEVRYGRDAAFIASARTDVPVLVKALRRQHAFIELTVGKLSRRSVRILNKEVVAILNQK